MENNFWVKLKSHTVGSAPMYWKSRVVVAIGIVILALGINVADKYDAPDAKLLGLLLMIAFAFIPVFMRRKNRGSSGWGE
jgi:hypothetical protein